MPTTAALLNGSNFLPEARPAPAPGNATNQTSPTRHGSSRPPLVPSERKSPTALGPYDIDATLAASMRAAVTLTKVEACDISSVGTALAAEASEASLGETHDASGHGDIEKYDLAAGAAGALISELERLLQVLRSGPEAAGQ